MITARDLHELTTLNSDGVTGFLMQAESGLTTRMALWPDHLTGTRWEAFRDGSTLARQWMAMRKGYGKARRARRATDFKEQGITTCMLPRGADRRAEQLECLRSVLRGSRLARTEV